MILQVLVKRLIAAVLISTTLVTPFKAFSEETSSSIGIQTLGLLNPTFPIKDVYDVLKDSRFPAFAFVHKSFGTRKENLSDLLNLLVARPASPGGCITVIVYADCGPCRSPRRPKGLFKVIQGSLTIHRLNSLLERRDTNLLSRLNKDLEEIRAYLPVIDGVKFILQTGLEDNFTDRTHAVFRSLALQVFRERNDIIVGRNPLHFKQASYPIEAHSYSLSKLKQLKKGDILAGDGSLLCFPGERHCNGIGLKRAQELRHEAKRRGVHLLYWRPEMQGLPPYTPGSKQVLISPDKRKYRIVGIKYLKQLVRS